MEYESIRNEAPKTLTLSTLVRAAAELEEKIENNDGWDKGLEVSAELERELVALLSEAKSKYYQEFTKPDMFTKKTPGDFEAWGFWHQANNFLMSQLQRGHRENHLKKWGKYKVCRDLYLSEATHKKLMEIAQKHFG